EKEYLPYVPTTTGSDGLFRTNALTSTNSFYNTATYQNTTNPYSQKTIEASPLNRVLEQAAPGNDWKKTTVNAVGKQYSNGHTIKLEYDTNDDNKIKRYNVTTVFTNNTYEPTLVDNGYYVKGTLYKTITKDENWNENQTYPKEHTTEEFKDKKGQIVLTRTYGTSVVNGTTKYEEPHDTYYVYDNYGNLTYVLPPKSEAGTDKPNTDELNELCYQYKYDHRKRLVEKRIPGRDDWDYIVYDKLDRPILTQEPELRNTKKWVFTKYDKLGRAVYSGIYTHNSLVDQQAMQSHFNSQNNTSAKYYETKLTSSGSLGIYYSANNFPTSGLEVLTVNYYDNYTFDRAGVAASVTSYSVNSTSNVKGLATGSKVKVLGTSNWTTTVNFYDDKARPIYAYTYNSFLQTTDVLMSKLDFIGKVEETTTQHSRVGSSLSTQKVVDVFTYDHVGRLRTQKQYLNNSPTGEFIVDNTYDELGQLKSKGIGGRTSIARLQTINYSYNVRGWLTNINQDGLSDNDLFNFTIKYNDITDTSKKLYNGNISQTSWNTTNTDSSTKTYTYTYDALNRITKGDFNVDTYDLTNVSYDKNGNITSLQRNKHSSAGSNDNFTYNYVDAGKHTNQLMSLSGSKSGTFLYDKNGNMTKDTRKNITGITYNFLNLPEVVTINGQNIVYTYDALGVKLRKVANTTTTDYAGNYTYVNNSLKYFNHTEGYYNVTSTGSTLTGNYIYQYRDHLQSVRLSFKDIDPSNASNTDLQILKESNYYPFGVKHKGYNNVVTSTNPAEKYGYQSKELNEELGLDWYDFGARNYDAVLGRWMNTDPLAEKFESFSPYNAMINNPLFMIDPDGMAANPVYDTNGDFLGTDNKGLQGKAIVMDKKDFKQGMSHEKALAKNKGAKGLSSKEAGSKLINHYDGLSSRPDYDGVVTFTEAKEWFNKGTQEALFVDASKMNLDPFIIGDFNKIGEQQSFNFFSLEGLLTNPSMGLTFGEIKMTLENKEGTVSLGNTTTGYLDTFDFEHKKNDGRPGRSFRNFGAAVGRKVFGLKGKGFDFYTYGKAKVGKVRPEIKLHTID
ncbi:MAG: hypothetical protein HWD85_06415, partial [Flavobacteriaceae bacterium]|nr:hypothetical protein [Flavobacteriaceae bacterium]